jgi:hypothetical protein
MIRRIALMSLGLLSFQMSAAIAAEPTTPATPDIPEEVLQTEVIVSARSPIDNRPLTATEYAELQLETDQALAPPGKVSRDVRAVVNYLKFRKFIKKVIPFIPLK